MGQRPLPKLTQTHLMIIAIVLVLIAIFRTNSTGILPPSFPSLKWKTQVTDATKNGNILLSLYLLDTSNASEPVSP
ncbi:hypothetical protein [Dehalobacter sp. TeCB1]|uniref:hypothetical protein n=1 Tax=Dehalobacter sp. TeCB1 TaxID=1843715 RepID=UPI00083ABBD9|nr:hypothetical protein [Dehalobacter sp. TeCB1]OCZ49824.1 hypothetical protein A7D23_00290 [Dehalobacter sp. TeCB1]